MTKFLFIFQMVAVETYVRLCHTRASYARFLSIPVGFVSVFIFVISVAVSGYGVYQGMDYDYCTRETYGDYTFRMITTLLLHGIPFTFTILFLVSSSLIVRARARRLAHYKRSKQYDRDYAFTNLNLACYALYVVAWIPYLIIVHQYPNTSDSNFYNCVWLGMSRSIVTSFLYSGLNGNFRRAYTNLFYYCCCKTSINERINNRHRTRAVDYLVSTGEVRVHIMHHSIATSPRRAGCSRDVARYTSEI